VNKLSLRTRMSVLLACAFATGVACAQSSTSSSPVMVASVTLDAPEAQYEVAGLQQSQSSSSSAQPAAQTPPAGQNPNVTSQEELHKEEHQRILGVVPSFNVEYSFQAPKLTAKQKLTLTMHTNLDPVVFGIAAIAAGRDEVFDDFQGYGWGAQGYFKRWGAEYADTFDGNLFGNALLPIVLHQDPRYFRMGTGTIKKRLLYSLSTAVVCRGDNGKRQPNISNVTGNLIAGGISNLYYPSSDRGVGLVFQNALTVTAEGSLGGLFDEFWPDISHKLFKKDKKLDMTYDTSTPAAH
jgi:hypothetical protein